MIHKLPKVPVPTNFCFANKEQLFLVPSSSSKGSENPYLVFL